MHPMDTSLDASLHESRHGGPASNLRRSTTSAMTTRASGGRKMPKRRTSLDNSCLQADSTFQHVLMGHTTQDVMSEQLTSPRQGRRFSFGNNNSTTTTFLAVDAADRPKLELDLDWHASEHTDKNKNSASSSTSPRDVRIQPRLDENSDVVVDVESAKAILFNGDDIENANKNAKNDENGSYVSDCDSFCDASVQEEANRAYLAKDLGASCVLDDELLYGSEDDDDLSDDDIDDDGEDPWDKIPDAIVGDGLVAAEAAAAAKKANPRNKAPPGGGHPNSPRRKKTPARTTSSFL